MFDNPIEFLCEEEDWDVIPQPYRAAKHTPDWFKKLPPKIGGVDKLLNSTIKRCMPFLDAMSVGWIIPLAADVEFISNGPGNVNTKSEFYKKMVDSHTHQQISTIEAPNPNLPKPPLKFLNYWAIKAKPGWSVLFVPPINRPDPRFECIGGLVDCDKYFEFVNFPFFFNNPNFTGIIPAGTPLVQAIPFKRSNLQRSLPIRKFNAADKAQIELTRRKRASHESLYRDQLWTKK